MLESDLGRAVAMVRALKISEVTAAPSPGLVLDMTLLGVGVGSTYQNLVTDSLDVKGTQFRSIDIERLDTTRVSRTGKVVVQILLALDAAVGDFTDFLGVKLLPRLAIQILVKGNDEDGVKEVDKCITHVAIVFEVNWQVEEIVAARMHLVDSLQEHSLGVLVGNVANHDRRAGVLAPQNSIQIDRESIIIISLLQFSRLGSPQRLLLALKTRLSMLQGF